MPKRRRKIVWYVCQSADDNCVYGDDREMCPFGIPFAMEKDLNFVRHPTFGECMHKDRVVFFKKVKKPKDKNDRD